MRYKESLRWLRNRQQTAPADEAHLELVDVDHTFTQRQIPGSILVRRRFHFSLRRKCHVIYAGERVVVQAQCS